MLHWLVGDCNLFGLRGQHWMLVVAGALTFYIASLFVRGTATPPASERGQRRPH